MTNQATPEVMNSFEAAEYLRLSRITILRRLKAGKLPGVKIGKEWRLSKAALDEHLRGPNTAEIQAAELEARQQVARQSVAALLEDTTERADWLKRQAALQDAEKAMRERQAAKQGDELLDGQKED